MSVMSWYAMPRHVTSCLHVTRHTSHGTRVISRVTCLHVMCCRLYWHTHMSRILLILAVFNCYLGLSIYTPNATPPMLALTAIIAAMACITCVCRRMQPRVMARTRTWSQPHIDVAAVQEMTRLKEEDEDAPDESHL